MLAYIIFSLLTNLTLSHVLCLVYLRSTAAPSSESADGDDSSTPALAEIEPTSERQPNESDGSAAAFLSADLAASAAAVATNALQLDLPWAVICAEISQKLQVIKERSRYARWANDGRLVRDVAEQLRTQAKAWCDQLQQRFAAGTQTSMQEPSQQAELPDGHGEPAELEMLLAQIEATLTNLDALDWTRSSEEILNKLDRETELLQRNQPGLVS